MTKNIVIKPEITRKYREFLRSQRILFFSAPCGFGKTCVAETLLAGEKLLRQEGRTLDVSALSGSEDWNFLLVEDFQLIQEEEMQALCDLIRRRPEKRFVLLSRGAPPGSMMAFQYAGIMTVITTEDLLFGREEIQELARMQGVAVTQGEVNTILRESIGYPLGVAISLRRMAEGEPYGQELVAQAFLEVYRYFETAVFLPFDLPLRRFLLELAPFETFDFELARMVSGDPKSGEMLHWLQKNTSMLKTEGKDQFRFLNQFRGFLLWEMKSRYTEEKCRALFSRGGLYYELKGDYSHALECYSRGGDFAKVSELLIRNSQMHPGMGHYSEMEKYYRSLPEQEILDSPALMQGMSMLCALTMDYEGSERWYEALKNFSRSCSARDAAGGEARSRMAWLDIALPQRGTNGLTETIPAVARLLTDKKISLPPFSVTSSLPSIMNGGKDFSAWSPKDDFLYNTIRLPVEKLLGADGVGLPDCALAESKFEKGEDVSQRMLTLVSHMGEIQRRGTPDIEFAACGLLARNYLAQGRPDNARRTLELLRDRFEETNQARFFPNIDAMLCRVDLHAGNLDRAESWYREKAPRNPVHLDVLKRYQYVTQAMVELAQGNPDGALMTLTPLENYCVNCSRYIDGVHLDILSALALYRMKDDRWRQRLRHALDTVSRFQFVRTISVYGGAVLPLLTRLDWDKDPELLKKILAHTRKQAAMDPLFLQPRQDPGETLTETEKQILRLICADKSNADIARMMDIKVTTVKTHVSHIFEKLDVSRRGEARSAAIRLRLIPEDSWMEEKECHL